MVGSLMKVVSFSLRVGISSTASFPSSAVLSDSFVDRFGEGVETPLTTSKSPEDSWSTEGVSLGRSWSTASFSMSGGGGVEERTA